MNFSELTRVIETVGKDKGVKREIIIEALEEAIVAAARKKYGATGNYEATFSDENGEVELFQFKTVVEDDDVADDCCEIELQEAAELDPDAQLGDEIGIRLENPEFGRIDAQNAKQIIFQKIRDAEREIIFNEFIDRKGELITGIARSYERGNVIVDLGKANAFLPRSEIIPGENIQPGDRVQAYLYDVLMTNRGPGIYLSRTSPMFLIKLFEMEVPEIGEGIVEIRAAAREPGQRAKIAVVSQDRDVDPVGACVGMRGIRVQSVVQELGGEKIDIVPWSDDLETFARNTLAPAEIEQIVIQPDEHRLEVHVDDSQLSLAIGRRGQNVRLAAMLTGWKVDIMSKEKIQQRTNQAVFQLKNLDGVSDTLAALMVQLGLYSLKDVAQADTSRVQQIPGFDSEEKAMELQQQARDILEKGGEMMFTGESKESELTAGSAAPGQDENRPQPRKRNDADDELISSVEAKLKEEILAHEREKAKKKESDQQTT